MSSAGKVWPMAKKTAVDKLNEALNQILEDYAGELQGNMEEIAVAMGKKGVQALRQKSKETFPNGTGEYARQWRYSTEKSRTGATVIIYNGRPGLPHLLENGHVIRNGTRRTFGRVPGREHIKPVADSLVETFQREVLDKI